MEATRGVRRNEEGCEERWVEGCEVRRGVGGERGKEQKQPAEYGAWRIIERRGGVCEGRGSGRVEGERVTKEKARGKVK